MSASALLLILLSTGPREVWVSPGAAGQGDGSRARPFATLGEALQQPTPLRIRLSAGLHAGGVRLPPRVELAGTGEVTLFAPGEIPVLETLGAARIEGVSLQGGSWGIEATGPLRLADVRFSGHAAGALRSRDGLLTVTGARFSAGASGQTAIALSGRARLRMSGASLAGAWRRGLEVRGDAEADLADVSFSGPETAVHQVEGTVRLRRVTVEGGSGPGLFVARGALRLEEVAVIGHEYGLLSQNRARLAVTRLTSVRAQRAGLGLVGSTGSLQELVIVESGGFGCAQLVQSATRLRRFRLERCTSAAVVAIGGTLRASDGLISGTRTVEGEGGDGIHLRRAAARIEGVVLRRNEGAGVWASGGSEVVLRDVAIGHSGGSGLVVERYAQLEAEDLDIRYSAGPALTALANVRLQIDVLRAEQNRQGLLWAECAPDARVRLGRLTTDDLFGLSAPCVRRLPQPP